MPEPRDGDEDPPMLPDWPARIAAAQREETSIINGGVYLRVRYGEEKHEWGASQRPCHDCGVRKDQYHVPGCDVEQCPCCGGQRLLCDCDYEEEREEDAEEGEEGPGGAAKSDPDDVADLGCDEDDPIEDEVDDEDDDDEDPRRG